MGAVDNIEKSEYLILGVFEQGLEKLLKIQFYPDLTVKFVDIAFLFDDDNVIVNPQGFVDDLFANIKSSLYRSVYYSNRTRAGLNNSQTLRQPEPEHDHDGDITAHNKRHILTLTDSMISPANDQETYVIATGGEDPDSSYQKILVPQYMARIIKVIQSETQSNVADYHLGSDDITIGSDVYRKLEFFDFDGQFNNTSNIF